MDKDGWKRFKTKKPPTYSKKIKLKKKPEFAFKALSIKWEKINVVRSNYDISKLVDFRIDTKVKPMQWVPEHHIQAVFGKSVFGFTAGTKIDPGWALTPMAEFTFRW